MAIVGPRSRIIIQLKIHSPPAEPSFCTFLNILIKKKSLLIYIFVLAYKKLSQISKENRKNYVNGRICSLKLRLITMMISFETWKPWELSCRLLVSPVTKTQEFHQLTTNCWKWRKPKSIKASGPHAKGSRKGQTTINFSLQKFSKQVIVCVTYFWLEWRSSKQG